MDLITLTCRSHHPQSAIFLLRVAVMVTIMVVLDGDTITIITTLTVQKAGEKLREIERVVVP